MQKLVSFVMASGLITVMVFFGCRVNDQTSAVEEEESFALAKKAKVIAEVDPSSGKAVVNIPENAAQVAPNVFSLGTTLEKGKAVEGYAFVHYKQGYGRTACDNDGVCEVGEHPKKCGDCSSGGVEDPPASTCYGYIANDVKWKTVEPYLVDALNSEGLTAEYVSTTLARDIGEWENAAGADILGDEIQGEVDRTGIGSLNGQNEVVFGDIGEPGAIAVTMVWGIFTGKPSGRQLVEWDMVFDEVDFDWSEDATGSTTEMDFENIAIHELGHSKGMGDLYDIGCADETMYGYATEGEIKKRSLEAGDIEGIQKLYK
ncbi:matrixin family metalloprotease [Fibrobacterota bacterium]